MPGRKRAAKTRIEVSEDEQTFINNSDYQLDAPDGEQDVHENENNEDGESDDDGEFQASDQDEGGAGDAADNATGEIAAENATERALDSEEEYMSGSEGTTKPLNGKQPEPTPSKTPELMATQTMEPLSYSQQVTTSPRKRARESFQETRNEPRLVISRLTLTNFKSYAGVQEIGPFNASFSAVVGPNGSGKSNVIDSMLFVFGFRALKMRQGKLSELIHNSEGGEKLDYCQVDIHFMHVLDDPTRPAVSSKVEGSDIVISRRATKANASQYYINGKSSNYTEVTQYLRGQGIDLDHKRFLILQGEVESIAQMKPKGERENDDGLLEYLEDIIGTSKYKLLIDESLVKVEELNQVCIEKENRFELVENDALSLEDKKNEALKFLEVEKKLIDKRSVNFQVTIHENNKIREQNQQMVTELSAKLEEETEKNKELSNEIDVAHEEKKHIQAEIAKLAEQVTLTNKKQKTINSQTVSLEEKLKNLGNKVKKIQKAKSTSESALSSSSMKFENMKSAEEKFKSDLAELERALEEDKAKLGELRKLLTEKTAHLSEEIQGLQTKLEPFNDQLKETDSNIGLVRSEMEMLVAKKTEVDNKLREASKRLVDIKAEGKTKEAELDALERKLEHIDEQLTLGEEQCKTSRKNLESKRVRLASARQKTQDAINSLANVQNRNKVLVSLMRLAKSGRISGFYGRLGDLGEIDDKYDVAISTACPGLDSMVVETVETAQACIDYLRKNKLGYATFICLNKLRNFDLRPIETPGNPLSVKRLFDLIVPKEKKFLPAFYSKLYNTLVASNLQEAKSVAYGAKRFKVVTLDGKVVDTSGTMSGGGNSFARGGMKLRSNVVSQEAEYSEEDIQLMKEELSTMEAKVEALSLEAQEMENNLRKLQELKPETEFALQTVKLDIQALVSERKEVSTVCKALIAEKENANASSEIDVAIASKQTKLDELARERDGLKLQMLESETKIIFLEEKIMEAGGVELKLQNSKVDSIKQKIEIIHEKTAGDHLALRKLENEIKRHTKIVADSEHELELADGEKTTIHEELSERQKALSDLAKQSEALSGQINDKESTLETINENLEELTAKINEFKSDEIELRNQLEKLNSLMRRSQKAIDEAKEALEGLVVRDSEPYLEWMAEEERGKYSGSDIHQLDEEEIQNVNMEEIEEEIEELESYMNTVKVDIEVLKEYGIKQKELEMRRSDLNESVEERDGIKNYCEDLKRKRLDEFMEGFNTISLSLKEMYQMITMGGNAELELVDSLDPFSEGILFSVMPPKKSWKNISNLSGGEKTLSSLALVFALHKYKPTPLYVMDEIDAALDFRNVSIVANYIKERTKNAQFVVISLRNNMFELAQQLVGIYKVNNRTRSISLQNRELFGAQPVPIK